MSTPLDVLEAQLSAHGWERMLGYQPGLLRSSGEGCTQFIDWCGPDAFRLWGGGLGSISSEPVRGVDVLPFLIERGAM